MPVSVARVTPLRALLLLLAVIALGRIALTSTPTASAAEPENGPIAATALSHLGTHGGQCWTFMRQVVAEATGRTVGFDYRLGFFEAGAVEVSAAEAMNGDIIQIANDANTAPWAYYPGQHTAIILENLGGGVFDAVDSNQNWDEWVRLRPNYNPYASAARYGLQVHIYRIPGGGPGNAAIPASIAAAPSDGATARVTAGGCLNLRSEPSLSASRVDCLPDGTTVTVTGEAVTADGFSWVRVSTPNGSGWVASQYLTVTSPGSVAAAEAPAQVVEEPASAPALQLATTDNSPGCLRVRQSPGVSGAAIDCLGAGNNLYLLGDSVEADGYTWVNMRIEGRVQGWVASEFLILR